MRTRSSSTARATLVLIVAGVLGLAGCSEHDDRDTLASSGRFGPVTISHAFGETTLTDKPTRIVALGVAATDALLALAPETLVGAVAGPVTPSGVSPWQQNLLDTDRVTLLRKDNVGGFDREAILSAEPDLVLAQEAANAEQLYRAFDGIVPVVAFHESTLGDSWQTVTRDVARVVGDERGGERLIAAAEQVGADAPPGAAGKTWMFVASPTVGKVNVLKNPDDPMCRFFDSFRLRLAPRLAGLPDNAQNPGTVVISEENYGLLSADFVIVMAAGDPASTALLDSPIYRRAVGGSVVWQAEPTVAMALRSPTMLATPWVGGRLTEQLARL